MSIQLSDEAHKLTSYPVEDRVYKVNKLAYFASQIPKFIILCMLVFVPNADKAKTAPIFYSIALIGVSLAVVIGIILYSRTYKLVVTKDELIKYSGNIVKKKVVIKKHRIKHYEISTNLIEKRVKASSVSFFTAGSSKADLVFPSIDEKELEGIIEDVMAE